MSRSLRWSCCATALVCSLALGGFDSAAFGQYAEQGYAPGEGEGWTPSDYSAAYAPYTAQGGCNSCAEGCAGDCHGGQCDCGGAYGDGYGGKGCCDDCGGDPYAAYGRSDYDGRGSCDSYGGDCGCNGSGGCGCEAYGGNCECGPCEMGCEPCEMPYYDNGAKCGRDLCLERRCRMPKCSVFGEYLFLQVSDVDVAHAQQQNGIGGAGTVPFGDIGTVGMDWEGGYRVGGSIACGPCSDVVSTYTTFEVDAESSIAAPDIPGGGGAVGSLVHHPGAAITASAGPLDARYEIDLRMGDIMCRSVWREGCNHMIRWMVGGQYGHLDQDFLQTGIFSGGQSGTINTSTAIDFDGGGLKAGIDGERRLGHGLSVYGKLTGAVMTGQFTSRYNMFNNSTDTLLAQADWKDDRAISQIEYELGVACVSKDCHWRATAGYMLSYWDNMVTTGDFIDAVQADNYTNVGDSITFDGFVSRAEFRW